MSSEIIVMLDMDGVMVDMTQEHLDVVNAKHGTRFKYEDITDWHYSRMTKEQKATMYESWHRSDLYDGEHMPQAELSALEKIRSQYRVIAVSSPMIGHIESKYRYLLRHGFKHDDIYLAKDKSIIGGDVLIDDGPHNINDFPGVGVLFSRPWNQDYSGAPRIRTFTDIPKILERILG